MDFKMQGWCIFYSIYTLSRAADEFFFLFVVEFLKMFCPIKVEMPPSKYHHAIKSNIPA